MTCFEEVPDFPLPPKHDSDEVVVEPAEENAQIDEIESFLKEIAVNEATDEIVLQTENKFLRDGLVENIKRCDEKQTVVVKTSLIPPVYISGGDNCGGISDGAQEPHSLARRMPLVLSEEPKATSRSPLVLDNPEKKEALLPESIDVALTREKILSRAESIDVNIHLPKDAEARRDRIVEMQVQKYALANGQSLASPQIVVDKEQLAEQNPKEQVPVVEKELNIAVFGSYKIKQQIGSGSHGVLYEAVEEITGRKVVLKTEKEENCASLEERTKNTVGEARINSVVDHENIMPVEGVVKDAEGNVYLKMPFIKGAKKAEITVHRTQKEIARIGKAFADALSAAHKEGIIHRDVKPENTLIDPAGKPYLLDFGIAKVDEKTNPELANSLTGTRFISDKTAGSIRYMPPEVLEGWKKADAQSDIYSLGKMLYRMALQSEEAIPGSDAAKNLHDKGIGDGLVKCIAKAVADKGRYKTAEEFAHDLAMFIAGDTKEVKVSRELEDKNESEQKLEEKVNGEKSEKRKYASYMTRIYRGSGLSFKERLMKTAEYLTYLNNVLLAFGTALKITDVNRVELERGIYKSGTHIGDVVQELSLIDFVRQGYGLKNVSLNQRCNEKGIGSIDFCSVNRRIQGSVGFYGGEREIEIKIVPDTVTEEDYDLLRVIKYFAVQQHKYNNKLYSFGKEAIWGSPVQKLESKGFTLEYAIDLFDNNRFRAPEVKFEKGKPAYTIEGKCVGYADCLDCSYGPPAEILFKKGLVLSKYFRTTNHNLIDLGDKYLLKPW